MDTPVAELEHDVRLYADRNPEEILDGHKWQPQHIVDQQLTPSGLEYEVSVVKTLWLPRATLDTKLVRRYRAKQRAATKVRTRRSSWVQSANSYMVQSRR